MTIQDKTTTPRTTTRQDKIRQEQHNARQDNARQDKPRQDNTIQYNPIGNLDMYKIQDKTIMAQHKTRHYNMNTRQDKTIQHNMKGDRTRPVTTKQHNHNNKRLTIA